LCEGNHPANYKGCTIYKDLQKRHFLTLRKKKITTKSQSQVEPARIQSETVQPGRIYASGTKTESCSSTVSQIHRATQERAVPSSPGQIIEEIMQVFQNELKEFMDKTSQLISGLMTLVTKKCNGKKIKINNLESQRPSETLSRGHSFHIQPRYRYTTYV